MEFESIMQRSQLTDVRLVVFEQDFASKIIKMESNNWWVNNSILTELQHF